MIIPSMLIPYVVSIDTNKILKLVFLQQKDNQILTADRYFSVEHGNSEK